MSEPLSSLGSVREDWLHSVTSDIKPATKEALVLEERQRCIQLIRDRAQVYLPMYIMDKLIADIEKGE